MYDLLYIRKYSGSRKNQKVGWRWMRCPVIESGKRLVCKQYVSMGGGCLKDDLSILKDMYPELLLQPDVDEIPADISETNRTISGALPFRISLVKDILVEYKESSLSLSVLDGNTLYFSIESGHYPDLRHAIKLQIDSSWMPVSAQEKLIARIHLEFDGLTDPESSDYDPYSPILMLIFGYLTQDAGTVLFPDYRKLCTSQEEYDSFLKLYDMNKKDQMSKTNYHCAICMDIKKGDKMLNLPCNNSHFLCRNCTASYYSVMIEEGHIESVRCPKCKFQEIDLDKFREYKLMKKALFTPAIPFSFFEGILSPELCKRYEILFNEKAATTLSKHCPDACVTCKRCNRWCVKEDLDDPMIFCSHCDFHFCFDCLHSWHGYTNNCGKKVTIAKEVIQEYIGDIDEGRKKELETKYGQRALELVAKEYISDMLLDEEIAKPDSDLQRCPKCRLVVQRSEGCNKMKCSVCGAFFCYICGSSLYHDDPYMHFREPYLECFGRLFEGMPGIDS